MLSIKMHSDGQFLQLYILLQWMQSYVLNAYEENISKIKCAFIETLFYFFQNIVALGKKRTSAQIKALFSVESHPILAC